MPSATLLINPPRIAKMLGVLLVLLLTGCASQPATPALTVGNNELVNRGTEGDLADGVRVLLNVSVSRGISDLARPNGYNRFDATRLSVPQAMDSTARFLRAWGRSQLIDALMMDINRSMEAATGRFEAVLQQRVRELLIPDVRSVMTGGDNAATALLCASSEDLRTQFAPVLKQTMTDVGYYATLNRLVNEYNAIPMLDDMEPFDVEPELQQRAVDAICLRIGEQESRLRRFQDERPTENTPDNQLLRTLFAWPF